MNPGILSYPYRSELASPVLSRGVTVAPLHAPLWYGGAWIDPNDSTRVLLLGGSRLGLASLDTRLWASRWDPLSGVNQMLEDGSGPNLNHAVALGLNGLLYTFGGGAPPGSQICRAIDFSQANPAWAAKTGSTSNKHQPVACPLNDGRILVVDGNAANAELYNTGANTWASAANPPAASTYPFINGGAWLLPNGHISIFNSSATWWDYDPGGNSWSQPSRQNLGSAFPPSRQVDPQGRIWYVNSNGNLCSYAFASDTITDTGVKCGEGTIVALPDGRVAIFGSTCQGGHWSIPASGFRESTAVQIVG